MKKLSTLAALAGALTMTVATVAHAEPKSSSTDKAATPCVGDKCVKTKAAEGKCGEGKCLSLIHIFIALLIRSTIFLCMKAL